MTSLPDVGSSRSRFARASNGPSAAPFDVTDSGVFQLFEAAVLVLAAPGEDLRSSCHALEDAGFTVVTVPASARLEDLAFLPRFAVVETAMPGAFDLLRATARSEASMQVLALLGPNEGEGPALAAGATLTLRRPLHDEDVLLCLRRFHAEDEAARQPRHVFDQARAMPATILESVLATIGHEIKNPLAAALAGVEYLRDRDPARRPSEAERHAAVDDAAIALRRIADVMGAVTSLVRGAEPALTKVSMWASAERAIDALGSSVRVELAGDAEVRGFANAPLLEQVLVNLLQNAVDAAGESSAPHVLVRVYRAGHEARISVRDNGPGVPDALRDKIFDPFFTTKGERGTGLGLVLVRHAVGRMGGTVTLGPTQNGAVFRVRLRAA